MSDCTRRPTWPGSTRIKDLQELLGFSLAEVRVVLDTEDIEVLDRLRSEYRWGDASPEHRRQLLDEAIDANEKLLERLDTTLARIGRFRRRARRQVRPAPGGPGRARRRVPLRPRADIVVIAADAIRATTAHGWGRVPTDERQEPRHE